MKYYKRARTYAYIIAVALCALDSEGMWMLVPLLVTIYCILMICLNMRRYENEQEHLRQQSLINRHIEYMKIMQLRSYTGNRINKYITKEEEYGKGGETA